MLDMVTATRFDRKMTNGKTKPFLMACDRADGDEVEVVVKLSGGCERGVGALVTEAIVAMFTADLALPVPDPFVVRIDPALVIQDAEIQALRTKSSEVAFGSRLLAPGHSVWPSKQTIPKAMLQQAIEIFALDALLLNSDRRPSNPNCQSDGRAFAIYDHELCFLLPMFARMPWEPNGLEYLCTGVEQHLFKAGLDGKLVDLTRFAGAVKAVTPQRLEQYLNTLPVEWAVADAVALDAINHLSTLRDNIEDAITEVTRVLS